MMGITQDVSIFQHDHNNAGGGDVNMLKSLQTHTHSEYCHRNKSCCFGFPKPPAANTIIS